MTYAWELENTDVQTTPNLEAAPLDPTTYETRDPTTTTTTTLLENCVKGRLMDITPALIIQALSTTDSITLPMPKSAPFWFYLLRWLQMQWIILQEHELIILLLINGNKQRVYY